jgi:hypothetical protein
LAAGINAGSSVDLNGALLPLIERSIVAEMQDAYNNFHNAAVVAKQGETASSGVLLDQLRKDAMGSTQKAERLSNSALSGASSTRSTVNSLASQIGNNTGGTTGSELRQAARDAATSSRRLGDLVRRLGESNSFGNGNLGLTSRALEDHRRYCEL